MVVNYRIIDKRIQPMEPPVIDYNDTNFVFNNNAVLMMVDGKIFNVNDNNTNEVISNG